MLKNLSFIAMALAVGFALNQAHAQDPTDEPAIGNTSPASGLIQDIAKDKISEKIDDVKESVNENETAQMASENILKPIYEAAEYLAHPWFHWVAFSMMVAGLISFGLQLVLGKLFMLLQFHFSLTEILADGLGFAISAIGLILTTQAAAENSTFTTSPVMVLSAGIVGLFFGLIFYVRGQTQELREARELRRRKKD